MIRTQFLDLDVLDSPVISPCSRTSTSSSAPGSSVAEKIFNDPDSWHDSDETIIGDTEMKDAMTWLSEELDKYDHHPGDHPVSPIDNGLLNVQLGRFSRGYTLMLEPAMASSGVGGPYAQWEGVSEGDNHHHSFLPIFEGFSMDFNTRPPKIWYPGSTVSPQSLPSPIVFSPPSSPSTGQSVTSLPTTRRNLRVLPLDLDMQPERTSTPVNSTAGVLSASTTWSILELYGARPDTPDSGRPLIAPHHPSALPPLPPVPHLFVSRRATPPPPPYSLTPQTSTAVTVTSETTPIRPLPSIPDSVREFSNPLPSRVPTPEPLFPKSLNHPPQPSQPSTSSHALPSVKILQHVSHKRSKLRPPSPPAPSPLTNPELSRKPAISIGSVLHQNPPSPAPRRMKFANITRFDSSPLPSARSPAPEPISPSTTPSPHPNGLGSSTRSPPLGPRPRSTTLPTHHRK